ncbi:13964_t:CDS:2 [Gigaspora margarita]|uniref:13964_t:CDS:1 n=1 Tax=Gigaspora margarita TaxID=4874 RepID=A0ABN7UK16_GIGMA|nr:13964_t:CDS:2 [Gigaspora margarita]
MSQIPKENQCVCKKDTPKADDNTGSDIKNINENVYSLFQRYQQKVSIIAYWLTHNNSICTAWLNSKILIIRTKPLEK